MLQAVLCMHLNSGPRRFALDGDAWVIGTGSECDIVLEEVTVSRRHARLTRRDDAWLLEDLGSTNATRINNLSIREPTPLAPGDSVHFGTLRGELRHEDAAEFEVAIAGRDRPQTDSESVHSAPEISPTIANDRIARFFIQQLPNLIARLRELPADNHATCIVDTLPDVIRGRWRLLHNDAVMAESGTSGPGADQQQQQEEDWRIELETDRKGAPSAFEAVAGFALSLIRFSTRSAPPGGKQRTRTTPVSADPPPLPAPETRHPGLRALFQQARRVAGGDIQVLIEGGSGTGKELFARFLHAAGGSDRPLVTLNCASLPADLLDAELFGIEQGVATGVTERAGKFEQAHGGVLFLDEIGDMHSATQARILRALQERQVYRIGADKPRPADVRVISATNRDMMEMVDAGQFRLDLYHRVADWQIRLPTLAERSMDIANLAVHFLQRACEASGARFGGISRAALECLQSYDWPGNVRELEREMKRCALFLESGEVLRSDHLQARIRHKHASPRPGTTALKAILEDTERRTIEQALDAHGGNIARAASQLNMGRSTLYRRIRELEIHAD